jgi:hypothetical protein
LRILPPFSRRYSTDKKVLKEDKGGSERYAPLETDVKAEAMFFIQIQYGKVVEVKIIEDKQSKKSKGMQNPPHKQTTSLLEFERSGMVRGRCERSDVDTVRRARALCARTTTV